MGRPDRDLEETRAKMVPFLPPHDATTYFFLIFDRATGEFVGDGGIVSKSSHWFGWPEIGYSLKKEAWGRGYATEFMTAFLESWWKLPRRDMEVEVDVKSLGSVEARDAGGSSVAAEQLTAMVEAGNGPSRRIMEKLNFRPFNEWKEADSREGYEGQEAKLIGYTVSRPTGES